MLNRRWSIFPIAALLALATGTQVSAQTQQTAAPSAQATPPAALPDACLDAAGHAAAVTRLLAARQAGTTTAPRQKNP